MILIEIIHEYSKALNSLFMYLVSQRNIFDVESNAIDLQGA